MIRLRRLRRLTAVGVHLLLVQFVFTSGAGACPLGDGMTQAAEVGTRSSGATSAEHHVLHDAAMDAGGPSGDARPTSAPSQKVHAPTSVPPHHHHPEARCDMACTPASCGSAGHCTAASAASPSTSTPATLASARGRRMAGPDRAPRSVSMAPEPPPPRG